MAADRAVIRTQRQLGAETTVGRMREHLRTAALRSDTPYAGGSALSQDLRALLVRLSGLRARHNALRDVEVSPHVREIAQSIRGADAGPFNVDHERRRA
jgi:hypothetical protein